MYLYESDATLDGNAILSNTAHFNGGGLALFGSNATLNGNTISFNIAGQHGGGLYLYYGSNATLTNDVVADNQANTAGSGIYVKRASPHLLHTTIARNTGGDGSGIHITDWPGDTIALTNTILVSHAVGIYVATYNTATLEATLWANDTDWDGAGTITTGTVNLWGDPAFVNPDAGDYHLRPDSAAIDAGVNAGITVDIDGDPRPIGAGYDIGADEFPAALSVTKEASPAFVQAGKQLAYTIRVTNTGIVTLTATVADTLPDYVTPTGVITWTPTVTAPGGVWIETIVVTVETTYTGLLTNVVQVATEEGATWAYTETATAYLPLPTPGDVLVDEIAWAGTSASSDHEWMELRNTRPYTLDLDTCVLAAQDGTPTIPLADSIAPNGYFLLERDAIATNVPYDLLYSGALDDDGERLTLTCDSTTIDTVDASTGWPAGHDGSGDPPFATMERHTWPADGWHTNDGVHRNGLAANGQPIDGTPRAPNSPAWSLALAADQAATAHPGDVAPFTHTLTNTGGAADTYTLTLETTAAGGQAHPVTTTLPAFQSTTVRVTVTVPVTAPAYAAYTVTLTARSWNSPTLSASNTDTVTVLCQPLAGVDIGGPLTGATDAPYVFTANISPGTATLPITYTWSPTPTVGQGTMTVTYTWTITGRHTITVTAENYCGAPVSDTHTITISPPPLPCYGLDDVDIGGPLTGATNISYIFTADISPGTATPPITYTWSPTPTLRLCSGQALSGQGTAAVTYTWTITGLHTITVTAENHCGAPVTDTHTITISPPPPIYLPFIARNWPPIHHVEDAPDTCPGYGPLELVPHQYHEDFDHPWDKDWYTFAATAGVTYTIQAGNLGSRADTVLYLYVAGCDDPDPIWNDDCIVGNPASGSCVTWQASANGTYHVFVRNYDWHQDYGPGADYTLTIQESR